MDFRIEVKPIVGLVIFIILIILLYFAPQSGDECESRQEYLDEYFVGVVDSKYKDSTEHMFNIINVGHKRLNLVDFSYDINNLYGFVQIGDSLIKQKGELGVRIKRKIDSVQLDTIIELNTNCKE